MLVAAETGDFDRGVPVLLLGLKPGNSWIEGFAPPLWARLMIILGIRKEIYPLVRSACTVWAFAFLCSRGGDLFLKSLENILTIFTVAEYWLLLSPCFTCGRLRCYVLCCVRVSCVVLLRV